MLTCLRIDISPFLSISFKIGYVSPIQFIKLTVNFIYKMLAALIIFFYFQTQILFYFHSTHFSRNFDHIWKIGVWCVRDKLCTIDLPDSTHRLQYQSRHLSNKVDCQHLLFVPSLEIKKTFIV